MSEIALIDERAYWEARERQKRLTKPLGALGKLEDIACWFAARFGTPLPPRLCPAIVVFAADHGVVVQGVSAWPQEVTAQMVRNFAVGGAAINVLAREIGASLSVVDVGVAADLSDLDAIEHGKVRWGSGDITREPAMSKAELADAVSIGESMAKRAIERGANLLIAGEMGIGNTTAAAALICAYTGKSPEEVAGYGAGADQATYQRKLAAIEQALARVDGAPSEELLRELGGLEIAAMAGFFRAAAEHGVPAVVDGFIAAAAALAASIWDVRITGWLLASHLSEEKGHALALAELGLVPFFDFGMRLGEGTGAALLVPILQAALALHREMATFDEAGVADDGAR